MLTNNDLNRIKYDIANMLRHHNTFIGVKNIKQIAEQPNWNQLFNEIDGDIQYDTIHNIYVLIESDITNISASNAGDRFERKIVIKAPMIYKDVDGIIVDLVITDKSVIVYNDQEYRILGVDMFTGEYRITAHRFI